MGEQVPARCREPLLGVYRFAGKTYTFSGVRRFVEKKPDVLPVTLRMARRSTPGPYPDPADPPVHWPASPVATWLGTPSPPDPGIPTDAAHQMCLSPPRACHHLPPSLRELAVFAYKLTPHSQSCRRPPEIARRHVPSRLQARSSVKLFSNPTIKAYAY